MKKYSVTGMSCAACQARVEKAVLGVDGVESCAVSLLTNTMGVEGAADEKAVIEAVERAGYGASVFGSQEKKQGHSAEIDSLEDKESPILVKRLIFSVIFLILLMYLSMGHMMWGWYVPDIINNHIAVAVIEMLLAIIVMVINKRFFVSGFRSLFAASPNMDSLVAMGSAVSFGYSLVCLLLMCDAMSKGDMDRVMTFGHDLYFESAAMIPTLITVGKLLEAKSKGRTTDALKSLLSLSPESATVIRDDKELTIPVEEVRIDDIYILRAGDKVPVDGVVIEGSTSVNESMLTGESVPVDKAVNDMVSAGTMNINGYVRCRATRVGDNTTLSQIIKLVGDAAATKAPLARIADKVSGIFVPVVIGLAVITFIVWMIMGQSVGFSIARAISVLVISCPCALGLATPVAIMVGSGVGAKNGILYKTAQALEGAGRVGVVVLDKTGTITKGEPGVTGVYPAEGISETELLKVAYSLEKLSEHPLAGAVVDYIENVKNPSDSNKTVYDIELKNFEALAGSGVRAVAADDGTLLEGGSIRYIGAGLSEPEKEPALKQSENGRTPLLFTKGGIYLGFIAVADQIKEDSEQAIGQLKNMGIITLMLTGDNERTAAHLAAEAGVDEVIAGVMPDEKERIIRGIQEQCSKAAVKVAMVGDGINDSIALTRADTGFAIGAGTDVAVDAADVVLMKNSVMDVAAAIRLSRAVIRNIHENLFWAFFYNALCIPLAMGVYGFALKPMYGAAAMALSSFFVCMNALRINLCKLKDPSKDHVPGKLKDMELRQGILNKISLLRSKLHETQSDSIIDKSDVGGNMMKKTMEIEGMMCEHCEATVKKALEKLDGVASAEVSHEAGTAVVELSQEVSEDDLRKAVEDKDYTVIKIS